MENQHFVKQKQLIRVLSFVVFIIACILFYSFIDLDKNNYNLMVKNYPSLNSAVNTDSSGIINRVFFAKRYIKSIEKKLLNGKDKVVDTTKMNSSLLEVRENDSLRYFVFLNNKENIEKVLFVTNKKLPTNCSLMGALDNTFILGYGSSTNNQDWLLFNKNSGKFIASGGEYLGKCSTKKRGGFLFFIDKNKIYMYSEMRDDIEFIPNFSLRDKNYSFLNWHWNFKCSKPKWEVLYKGDFTDTIYYNPATQQLR